MATVYGLEINLPNDTVAGTMTQTKSRLVKPHCLPADDRRTHGELVAGSIPAVAGETSGISASHTTTLKVLLTLRTGWLGSLSYGMGLLTLLNLGVDRTRIRFSGYNQYRNREPLRWRR